MTSLTKHSTRSSWSIRTSKVQAGPELGLPAGQNTTLQSLTYFFDSLKQGLTLSLGYLGRQGSLLLPSVSSFEVTTHPVPIKSPQHNPLWLQSPKSWC